MGSGVWKQMYLDITTNIEFNSLVITLTTIILAFLTYKYVKLTHHMLQEMKMSREPFINVDLELDQRSALIVFENSGQSPAFEVKFGIETDAPFSGHPSDKLPGELPPVKNGISYFPPNRTYKYRIRDLDWDQIVTYGETFIKVTIEHINSEKSQCLRCYQIDLKNYAEKQYDIYSDPITSIAASIDDGFDSLKRTITNLKK